MKKTKLLSFVLAAAMLAIPLAGCSQDEGADGGKETIKIGGLAPLSGDVSQYGVAVNNAVKMAVEDINAKGGILGGRKIEYIVTDEKGDSTEAVNAYNALMDQEIVALIGDVTSKPCKAVAAKAAADNMPMLTPSGTDADITKAGKNVFRACFIDPYQGQLMANYAAKKLNAKTAAILYDSGDPYSTGIADAFEEAAKKEGMEVTNKEGYASKSTDFKTQLTKIKGKNPDVLLIPVYYGDVALIVDQIQQQGITSKLLGADGWDGVLDKVEDKSVLEGAMYCCGFSLQSQDAKVQEFIQKYTDKYGEAPKGFSAQGYDAAYLLVQAIEEAGSTDKAAVVEAMKNIQFDGVTGHIIFDEERNPIKGVMINKLTNGTIEYVESYEKSE